jgi:Transposase DDE domain
MKTRTRRFVKLTTGTELRTQIVTAIKVRRGPANDNVDFGPVVRRAHRIKRIKLGIGDKGYDAEKNHELLRDELHAQSIIPARHEDVPVWRTGGRYRKEMKRGYSKARYHQRSKDETVFSVIKRTMGDEVRSIGVKGQNNEMRMKIISYNAARIASLTYSLLRGFLQSHKFTKRKYLIHLINKIYSQSKSESHHLLHPSR